MDVQCPACKAEYDFDDALVSARGTTVRCTSCGHQFKVRRPGSEEASNGDEWVVEKTGGARLVYRSLRELQKGILTRQVQRSDWLLRGPGPKRPLGAIAELDPFFQGKVALRPSIPPPPLPSEHETITRRSLPPGYGPTGGSVVMDLATLRAQEERSLESAAAHVGLGAASAAPLGLGVAGAPHAGPPPSNGERPTPPADAARVHGLLAEALGSSPRVSSPQRSASQGSASQGSAWQGSASQGSASQGGLGDASSAEGDDDRKVDSISESELEPVSGLDEVPPPAPSDSALTVRRPPVDPSPQPMRPRAPTLMGMAPPPVPVIVPPPTPSSSGALVPGGTGPGAVSPQPPPLRVPPPPPPSPTGGVRADGARRSAITAPMDPVVTPPPVPVAPAAASGAPPAYVPPPQRPPAKTLPPTSNLPPPSITVDGPAAVAAAPAPREPGHSLPPPQRRIGGWVLAGLLVSGLVVGAVVVGRPYVTPERAAAAPKDPRVAVFVRQGQTKLEEGDLEAAKENVDKALALADADPTVAVLAARLAAARADGPWLHERLLAPDAAEEARLVRLSLDEMGRKAVEAADAALALAPGDPAALRTKVDALRIRGDLAAARAQAPRLGTTGEGPDAAYVLAALDLAEAEPPWPVVLDRLRRAAQSEGSAGRARVALVYALARSGDIEAARAELGRLSSSARPPPLLPALRAFVDRTATAKGKAGSVSSASPAAASAAAPSAAAPSAAAAHLAPSGAPVAGGAPAGAHGAGAPVAHGKAAPAAGAPTPDGKDAISQGEVALRRNDADRARLMYEAALAKNPQDSEALAGLGDVARKRRDVQTALSYYRKALAVNPSYLPALLGQGDLQWELGDRVGAMKTYRDIVDRFPESAYPSYVQKRVEGAAQKPSGGSGNETESVP